MIATDAGTDVGVLVQSELMKSKLDVIEKMFNVSLGVMVVDAQLADWLRRIVAP